MPGEERKEELKDGYPSIVEHDSDSDTSSAAGTRSRRRSREREMIPGRAYVHI